MQFMLILAFKGYT